MGDRGAAALWGALHNPSTCCTDSSRFGSIFASIARPSKHGSHHVCDNRAPQRTSSSRRTALTDSRKPCAPIHIGSHCRLRLGSHVSPYLRDSAAVPVSLFGERAVIPSARLSPVFECSQVFAWTISSNTRRWQIIINVTAAVAASDICNNGMEAVFDNTPSNLTEPLAAILLVSGICNNSMEVALKHTVQPCRNTHRHSLSSKMIGDNKEQASTYRQHNNPRRFNFMSMRMTRKSKRVRITQI
jgi:hypothetical protein